MVNLKVCKTMKNFFIGVDVSKKTLDCVIYDASTSKMRTENYVKISNDAAGCKQFGEWLKQKEISKKDVIVCMEFTGSYSYNFAELLQKKKIDFCLVPAMRIKGASAGARGKDDKNDAIRIAEYAFRYRDKIPPMSLKDKEILDLRDLMNDRKLAVKHMAAYKTIMTEHKDKPGSARYKRASKNAAMMQKQVKEIEGEILELIGENANLEKNYKLLTSIPGISLVNAVNLIIFTNNFQGFTDARKFAAYCGIAPFAHKSGTSIDKGMHVSKMADKTLKADLSMAAKAAARYDKELLEYYNKKRGEGKAFGCVLNAVKFKLVCRAFAVVKRGTEYVNTKKYAG